MSLRTFILSIAFLTGIFGCGDLGGQNDRGRQAGASSPDRGGPGGDNPKDPGQSGDQNQAGDKPATDQPGIGNPASLEPLPFALDRPDRGNPVTTDELKAFTARYLDLLKTTRYFRFVDERVHGWPKSDPKGGYWYSQWWEYTFVVKSGGKVTFDHYQQGSDNTGVPTATLLEGACYAHRLWGGDRYEKLARKLIRAFNAWGMAMKRSANDNSGPMIARAFYPPSIDAVDDGRSYRIDNDKARPGVDNGATEFVQIPQNPYWGDIWIKNKRSKDDVGHMIRALAQVSNCRDSFSEETRRDVDAALAFYQSWAQQVEANGFAIASLNKSGQPYIPSDTLAHYITALNAECNAALAFRLLGGNPPGNLNCGTGVGPFDAIAGSNDQNRRILESHHEAATALARKGSVTPVAIALAQGLASRIDKTLDGLERGSPDAGYKPVNFAALIMHAANVGVPLTSREVRWMHGQVAKALQSYATYGAAHYDVFNPATPDGRWRFTPYGDGLEFREIGVLLGSCSSRYRNAKSRPLLDCEMIKNAKLD